jgi:hypothetical protein
LFTINHLNPNFYLVEPIDSDIEVVEKVESERREFLERPRPLAPATLAPATQTFTTQSSTTQAPRRQVTLKDFLRDREPKNRNQDFGGMSFLQNDQDYGGLGGKRKSRKYRKSKKSKKGKSKKRMSNKLRNTR